MLSSTNGDTRVLYKSRLRTSKIRQSMEVSAKMEHQKEYKYDEMFASIQIVYPAVSSPKPTRSMTR